MARTKALSVDLPKWPAMTVMGDRITPAQAAEVIIRTTSWYGGCNDREWERIVWDAIGAKVTITNGHAHANFDSIQDARDRLHTIPLEYLANQRVMSSWIGGPHGWCDWSGDIHSTNYNIGKWPSVETVRAEWAAIAEAFPFLRLRCQLWSGETSEEGIRPLVEFTVARGKVRTATPRTPLLHPSTVAVDYGNFFARGLRERGCDEATLRGAIEQALDNRPRPSAWDRLAAEEAP